MSDQVAPLSVSSNLWLRLHNWDSRCTWTTQHVAIHNKTPSLLSPLVAMATHLLDFNNQSSVRLLSSFPRKVFEDRPLVGSSYPSLIMRCLSFLIVEKGPVALDTTGWRPVNQTIGVSLVSNAMVRGFVRRPCESTMPFWCGGVLAEPIRCRSLGTGV